MLQFLLILLSVFSPFFALAADDFGPNWIVSKPVPSKILLTNRKDKSFILISKFETTTAVSQFEEYFADQFVTDAKNSRQEILDIENDQWSKLETGTNTFKGIRYGATSFDVKFGSFFERTWATEKTLWHVAMFTKSSSLVHQTLNNVMEQLSATPKTSSFDSLLSISAHASADGEKCYVIPLKELDELSAIVPKEKCVSGIHGIKLKNTQMSNCLSGSEDAFKKMKEGFLSSLESWEKETGKKVKSSQCRQPVQGKGFMASIAYPQQVQSYQACLTSAGISAGMTLIGQSIMQTANSLKGLYRWVKAEENPWGVIASILATEYKGFMCMEGKDQLKAICEFSTQFASAIAGSVAGSAGAALAIHKSIKAIQGLTTLGRAQALVHVKKNINGVSAAFLKADPFVESVTAGKAEAARIAKALRDGAILTKTPDDMDKVLRAKGFTRIDTCIKFDGKCVKHINPKTGKEEVAPMVVYVHPSGLAARLKPQGQSNAKFRSEPHGSFMLVNPSVKDMPKALQQLKKNPADSEKFMNEYLSWDAELAKVDMKTGKPLPSAPARTRVPAGLDESEKTKFHDQISDMTHFTLK